MAHLFETLAHRYGPERLAGHFHDTRAMGLTLTWVAIECGIRKFDSSIGGLGGCPFAPGATGNLATEDLVFMASEAGFETGIDVDGLRRAVAVAEELTGQSSRRPDHALPGFKREARPRQLIRAEEPVAGVA